MMSMHYQDGDLIRYIRENADSLIQGGAYLADIVDLADQIKDEPDNRVKLTAELRRKRALLEAHVAAVQGLLERVGQKQPETGKAA